MQLCEGSLLANRYRILRLLGKGGTSLVYLAMDEKIQRLRAVKVMKEASGFKKEVWMQEQKMLILLHHENLAEIYDVSQEEELVYLVMEYIEGYTLKELLARGKTYTEAETIQLGIAICKVLMYLHNFKPAVIHRDIKPENIMIRSNGSIVLIDFGTARECVLGEKTDTICWGTPGYAAPEVLEGGGQSDPRSDLYSLGVTLYEIVYGKKFDRTQLKKRKTRLNQIIEKCTRKEMEERFASAEELCEILENPKQYKIRKTKKQKRERVILGIVWGITVCLFYCSWVVKGQSVKLKQEGYARYIEAAERQDTSEKKVEKLCQAIRLCPDDGTAYFQVLDEFEKGGFDKSKYAELMKIINQTGYQGLLCEEELRKSKSAYTDFSYRLGLLCFFSLPGEEGGKYGNVWLTHARNSSLLDQNKRKFVAAIQQLIVYEEQIANGNLLWYQQYWKDINQTEKCMDWGVESEFPYQEQMVKALLSRILRNLESFYKANVSEKELLDMMDRLEMVDQNKKEVIEEGKNLIKLIYEIPA